MKAEIERIKAAGSAGKAPANGAERVAELQSQLSKAEADDAPQEREVALLKRRALIECERKKWAAFREYGAKLALLADASEALLVELPEHEPQGAYSGASNTARIRSQLQHAIDSYTPPQGQPNQFKNAPPAGSGVGLPPTVHPTPQPGQTTGPGALAEQRFGSQQSTGAHSDSLPVAQAPGSESVTRSSTTATAGHGGVPATAPLNPTSLNHAPASIPGHSPSVSSPLRDSSATELPGHASSTAATGSATSPSAGAAPVPIPSAASESNHITVAETGVPLTAGAEGPGPKSGSLSRTDVPTATGPNAGTAPPNDELPGFAGATRHETAEEEKARLAREERERLLHGSTASGGHLSAEEEKARLEREERERLLRGQQTEGQGEPGEEGKVPPPYADF
ncbi:sphingolipid long chain base-responsive protein LSP1 [Ceratobasidium sp. AG-Ba]|nr:sphingolipid long chain base-responsive protein LSP1 [Ceratobasidium sp. AG-Ba]